MTPKYFTGVEYTNIQHIGPLWGLSGTHWASRWDSFALKLALLGEKLLSVPKYPGNVQNITGHSVWMGNIDIMHFFPFLQHNQLSMCSCHTHLKLLLSSFHSEGIRGLKRITRIFILQLVQKANNLRTILKCQQSMIMNKIYNWFLMMMIKRIYSAGSCSDSRQRKRQVVTRRRLTHCC